MNICSKDAFLTKRSASGSKFGAAHGIDLVEHKRGLPAGIA